MKGATISKLGAYSVSALTLVLLSALLIPQVGCVDSILADFFGLNLLEESDTTDAQDSTDGGDTTDGQDASGTNGDATAVAGYAVVDTGQDVCYNDSSEATCPAAGEPFYGQDAQYDGNQPSYTLSADGLTVYDNVTGLTWTYDADLDGDGDIDTDDKRSYDEAQLYPATLNAQNYGGYSDWRVPTIKELYSLIDFRGTDPRIEDTDTAGLVPFIDTDYFAFGYGDTAAGERIIDSQWATSTLYTADNNMMFGVNFADGRIKGYGRSSPDPQMGETTFYVRLCRGNTDYGVNDFVDNGDGTVNDEATGLMWTQSDSGAGMNWEDALAWAEQRNAENYLGYRDWRVPNAKELHSILDYTRSPDTTGSAAIDPIFSATQITNEAGEPDYAFYWTGTTFLRSSGGATEAVYVAFGRGLGSFDGVNVVDVHGAGCQRSDPKDGDSNDFPRWGGGPQGDVGRVFNYVRLVRGGIANESAPALIQDSDDQEEPPPPPPGGDDTANGAFTIEQTLSDQAQRNTIAFDGLAFLTGDLCADSFLPPGKVSDLCGFQYLRDNDADGMGHNTDFVPRIANNVLYILTDSQVAELVALAEDQVNLINEYAYMRFPLMDAFRRLLKGDVPDVSDGLDKEAVMAYSAQLYRVDGLISFQRAEVLGGILRALDQSQLAYLDSLAATGMLSWPDVGDQVDPRAFPHDVHVAVMTYAGQLFSWYAGSVEADTYFCPERQGTYFGSFYLKDIPAMGNPNYSIDENLTGRSGEEFLAALTESQAELVTSLVDIQWDALNDIVDTRREIATELRRFMTTDSADSDAVLALAEKYGELDGEIVYCYATHFAEVGQTLSSEQQAELMALRDLDDFPCVGAYLYSEPIAMPEIEATDFLFGAVE